MKNPQPVVFLMFLTGALTYMQLGSAQKPPGQKTLVVPKTWDDEAMATLEVPLANPVGSPKHVSADYYYKILVRPIYKGYSIYAPGHEPASYMERLQQQDPVVVWDNAGHAPALQTEADWVKAGENVFQAPILIGGTGVRVADVRNPDWYAKTGVPVTKDGLMPFFVYVIRKKGEVEVGRFSCAMCHTRVMPDGSVIKGAQGNFPLGPVDAFVFRQLPLPTLRAVERRLFAVPWLQPDPQAKTQDMSLDEITSAHEAITPGVMARHRSSLFWPVQVPDLIGVKDRRYLDRTGLQQHRSIVDLMRYAALNQGADDLASYDGFIPVDFPEFKKLPEPTDRKVAGRYSDEQLYALALYIYSLQAPPNPNRFDALAARGKEVFSEEGCARCHTPPLYTNNKLTPAQGFTPPPDAFKTYRIIHESVETDPNLALKTRRGTGYYKVPSLKGVWYRGPFEHDGSVATLEDWFDPKRLNDDYVPSGFKGYKVTHRAVPGHEFGLDLSDEDRKALIAFLKTL